jgi:putative ABC transport system permease protein
MDSLVQDIRYALRTLLKARGFTVVALLTLALGIGANTTVFSMVDAVLLRPLPYTHPDRLVKIWGQYTKFGLPQNAISEPEWWDMRAGLTSFSAMAAYSTGGGANLTREASEPVHVKTTSASADLFPLLGVKAAMGRVFTADEDQPGRDRVAVLDYGFWKSQMAGDLAVIGHDVQLNGEPYTVIGVLPKRFSFGQEANIWLPLALDKAKPLERGSHYLEVIARLKPGVSLARASADVQSLGRHLETQYPAEYPDGGGFGFWVRALQTEMVGDIRLALLVVFAAVGFVLLIGCLNLANLLLARSSARRREIAIRSALGAGRLRLVRQLVTESVLLSLVGGILGVFLALWATELLGRMAAAVLPVGVAVSMDGRVLLFAAGLSVLTGLAFGLAPALQTSGPQVYDILKDAARGSTEMGGRKLRDALVIAEISVALVLLVAAGLMVRSLQHLLRVNPGFEPEHLLTARISLPEAHYKDKAAAAAFYRDLAEKLQSLPGVRAAGFTSLLPMTGRKGFSGSIFVEQTPVQGFVSADEFKKPFIEADQRYVTPGFFAAMQISLLQGRTFTDAENADARVAIVDQEFARRFWPNQNPLGQRVATGPVPNSNPPVPMWRSVVGVVGHVKNDSLDQQGREQIYFPLPQGDFANRSMHLTIRASGDPTALTSAIEREVQALDPSLPLYDVRTMDEWLGDSVAQRRLNMLLLGTFGGLALLLASLGTYGVIAYSVSQRTQEIGIRMALGARHQDVMSMVIGNGIRLAMAGVAIGIVLGLAATRLMSSLLFDVRSTDLLTFATVATILMVMAVLAAFVPALRAARLDPMVALRYE